LKRDYFIYDPVGQVKLSELELPVRVGGKNCGGIVIPGIADDQLLAIIALDDDHAYIQPAKSTLVIFHNDERLADSAWLKSGDRVQLAESILSWDIQGDRVLISVRPHQLDIDQLRPPQQAPAAPVNDSLPVSEKDPAGSGSRRLRRSVIGLVTLLSLIAAYLLTATSVVIKVEPAAATVRLKGFPPAISLGGSRLVFPGGYQLNISSPGYVPIMIDLDINMGPPVNLAYELAELPGLLTFNTSPLSELQLLVDGTDTPANAEGKYAIERGTHRLRVETPRYLPQQLDIEVEGFGTEQTVDLILEPAWAVVTIGSSPDGAEVLVDGSSAGFTPLQAEILQGQREIRLQKTGFKPVTAFRSVEAGKDFSLDEVQLQPVDGELTVRSIPAEASILIGGKFLGTTPQTLQLTAETDHKLQLSKAGYTTAGQAFRLAPDEQKIIEIQLAEEYASVFLKVQPAGAILTINGRQSSLGSGRLRLQTRKNTLEVSKPGYVSQRITVTPQAGVSQTVNINLVTQQQQQVQKKEAATPGILTTASGQTLELVKANSSFHMGASRADAGRRANESQRLVKLQRPFYLAHQEVSGECQLG